MSGQFLLPDGEVREVTVAPGTKISEAAIKADVLLNVQCGGKGSCGGCAVDVLAGTFRTRGHEFTVDGNPRRRVLGCQTLICSTDWRIAVPRRSLVETGATILVNFDCAAQWSLNPTVRKYDLELPPATLEDSAADVQRIERALTQRHGVRGLTATLRVLRRIPQVMTESDFHVTATVAEVDGRAHLIRVEPGNTTDSSYGLAADIGTTTVAVFLVDLNTGEHVDAASCYNQQVSRCDDVAARIAFCYEGPEAVAELQQLIVEATLNRLIRRLALKRNLRATDFNRMVLSGNTTMLHLLMGISPVNLGAIPFQPATHFPGTFHARELGLALNPDAPVDLVPSIAGYIGADIVSDLYLADMHNHAGLGMLIDIGTNGEIALGGRDGIVACATAAGPAFEGGRLSFGMRASSGAVDTITIDPDTHEASYTVIGGIKPHGLCGSAVIDFVGQGLRTGLLNTMGRFEPDVDACPYLRRRKHDGHTVIDYVIVPADQTEDGAAPITISERDLNELLQAKAAIYTGTLMLLRKIGKTHDDLDCIYLAGGFAKHINLVHAITMGLLPDIPLDKYHVIGNASLGGATLALVDREVLGRMDEVARRPRAVELNREPGFEDEFTNALFLPNLMTDRFPSVTV